jgi:elongation factor Ts
MSISASQVNELRQLTGAGMMDCKKALTEAGGDFDKAVEILRKKGQKVSESRKDREAKEGAIFAKLVGTDKAVMLELNCETDFVARNEDFQKMGNAFLDAAAAKLPKDLFELEALQVDGKPIHDHLQEAMAKIGEKISISKYELMEGGHIVSYIHPGSRVGVLVAFDGVNGNGAINTVGRDVAMQVAAMNPLALDKDGVDVKIIEREIEIGKEQARAEGKKEDMLEKIAQGKLNKFYKEHTLLNQEFVKDPSKTIAQYIKEADPKLKIIGFKRMHLGFSSN